uniref:Baculoviral IAP repeat containing 5b n=1 Tax=Cyprinus carpio TaxID=7962 RepID=A0A8C1PGX0_CYPCA
MYKDCQCTPELMAKAGFAHCPSENEPEVACCFYCLRELEGWEPEDNPWSEHAKCSPNCAFLCMKKTFDKLTAIEYFQLEQEWLRILKLLQRILHLKEPFTGSSKTSREQFNCSEEVFRMS